MPYFNKLILMGHLTREPETKYTSGSNTAICTMGLAVGGKRKDKNGQEIDETVFIDVQVFGKTAEVCQRNLAKGSCVLIEGKLKQDTWQDRNGGGKRSKMSMVGDRVQFIPSGAGAAGQRRQPPQMQTAQPQTMTVNMAYPSGPAGDPIGPEGTPGETPPFTDDIPF